jgi:hypothetical protein
MRLNKEQQRRIDRSVKQLESVAFSLLEAQKPYIEKTALSFKVDMMSHQGGFNWNEKRDEPQRFTDFQSFCYELEERLNVGIYFQVEDGEFKWLR